MQTSIPKQVDYGFLPIPLRCQYDASQPAVLNLGLYALFFLTSVLSIANFYVIQPILVTVGEQFNADPSEAARIPLFMQAGFAAALIFICPMGDQTRRRPLLMLMVFATVLTSIGLAFSPNMRTFQLLSLILGGVSQSCNVLTPLVMDIAGEGQKGRALTVLYAAQLLGIVFARVFAGAVSAAIGYRWVFIVMAALQAFLIVWLWWACPDFPRKSFGGYLQTIFQLVKFFTTKLEPLLVQSLFTGFFCSAVYAGFWTVLSFLLTTQPYHFSDLQIGLFGLLGLFTTICIPFLGILIDRSLPWLSATFGCLFMASGCALFIGLAPLNLSGIMLPAIILDLGVQTLHVANIVRVQALDPVHTSKLNSVYWITTAVGQFAGTQASTSLFLKSGTRPAGGLWLGWAMMMVVIFLVRGPHVHREQWFGWAGCYKVFGFHVEEPTMKSDVEDMASIQLEKL